MSGTLGRRAYRGEGAASVIFYAMRLTRAAIPVQLGRMERKDRIDAAGAALLVGFAVLMGLNHVAIKLVNSGMQPVFQAGLRSAIALGPVLVYAVLTGKRLGIRDGSLGPGLMAGLFFAGEFILIYQSLDFTSVPRAVVLLYTMPFWVALGAHFMIPGESLSRRRFLGLVLAFLGVALAMARNASPATEYALIGDLMALVAAVCWAGIVILTRTTRLSRASAEMQLIYQVAVSAVLLIALGPMLGPVMRGMTPGLWGLLGFQAIGVVCIGFLGWLMVLKVYPASDVASFGFLAPICGVTFGWLILGEPVTWTLLSALALVAVGIVLVNRRGGPAQRRR